MTPTREPARHQERALGALSQWWRSRSEDKRHGFLSMPTGSGKTFTAVRFAVHEILSKTKPGLLWVAHNDYLLQQAEETFIDDLEKAGLNDIDVGRVRGDGTGADNNVMLVSIQMLERGSALEHIIDEGEFQNAIFDEFHHMAAASWQKEAKRLKNDGVRLLGLSATPFRVRAAENERLRKIFSHRVFSVGTSELIRAGFLAKPIIKRVHGPNSQPMHLDEKELGQYRQFHRLPETVLRRLAVQTGRDDLIVNRYLADRAGYGQTIVFCCDVLHAIALAQLFQQRGVRAESICICGSAKAEENKTRLEGFKRGDLQVVTSVALLTEGVDVPTCRSVFLGRPTESPILLMQMIGRAMRGPKANGGLTCNIVDFVDVFEKGFDLSASANAFLRDFEPAARRLLERRPRPEQQGVDIALFLRVREFFNRRMAESRSDFNALRTWEEEVVGWFEHWDGQMQRVLLLSPKSYEPGGVVDTLTELAAMAGGKDAPRTEDDAREAARSAYHERDLVGDTIPEEDFVNIGASLASGAGSLKFHDKKKIEMNPELCGGALAAIEQIDRELTDEPELRADVGAVVTAMREAFARHRSG